MGKRNTQKSEARELTPVEIRSILCAYAMKGTTVYLHPKTLLAMICLIQPNNLEAVSLYVKLKKLRKLTVTYNSQEIEDFMEALVDTANVTRTGKIRVTLPIQLFKDMRFSFSAEH